VNSPQPTADSPANGAELHRLHQIYYLIPWFSASPQGQFSQQGAESTKEYGEKITRVICILYLP
jgi:hypothetical protein